MPAAKLTRAARSQYACAKSGKCPNAVLQESLVPFLRVAITAEMSDKDAGAPTRAPRAARTHVAPSLTRGGAETARGKLQTLKMARMLPIAVGGVGVLLLLVAAALLVVDCRSAQKRARKVHRGSVFSDGQGGDAARSTSGSGDGYIALL